MAVVIGPAPLCTHAMLKVLSAMDKTIQRRVDLACDADAGRRGEFEQLLVSDGLLDEGPWQRASHLLAKLDGSSDASSLGWVGVVNIMGSPYIPSRRGVHE